MNRNIYDYSNPSRVQELANKYLGNVKVYLSTRTNKKYMIQDPQGHWVHFGAYGMEDYTKHKNKDRQRRYLARATNIAGKWKQNKYSPNNLSIHLLWND